jgi:outer membrane immunogenic protein
MLTILRILVRNLKLIVTAAFAVSAILGIGSAPAADLPVKARPYTSPAPVSSWTGFYAGLNVGGVWANTDIDYTASLFGYNGAPGAAFLNAGTSGRLKTSGFTGGGQVGYNYQTGAAVWGLEADLNYTGLSGTRFIALNFAPIGVNITDPFTQTMQSNWLATFRGRLGYTTGPLLFYATGGLAVANVSYTDFAFFPASNSTNAASSSSTRAGWTVGGGAEWMIASKWSVKAEYLYVDLGSTRYTSINSVLSAATITNDHRLTENIGRVGFNYRLGN